VRDDAQVDNQVFYAVLSRWPAAANNHWTQVRILAYDMTDGNGDRCVRSLEVPIRCQSSIPPGDP